METVRPIGEMKTARDAEAQDARSTGLSLAPSRDVASREMRLRAAFALVGFALAAGGVWFADPAQWLTYGVTFALLFVTYFFWVDLPPPWVIVLPYLSTTIGFVYIVGPVIATLDYVAERLALAVMVALHRRGAWRPPLYLRRIIELRAKRKRIPRSVAIDYWSVHAIIPVGLVARWICFTYLTAHSPQMSRIVAIGLSEIVSISFWGVLTLLLPLPFKGWMPDLGASGKPVALDERIDQTLGTFGAFLEPLVFLISYGYAAHGLPGAVAWSLVSIAPHYILKLLNDRREALRQQHDAMRETSASLKLANEALEEKQEELRTFVYTVTHDLKNPLGAIQITADLLRESDGHALSRSGAEHLERIIRLATSTDEMIRDLMELFKITSTPEPHGWVDLDALVARTLDALHPQIQAKGIEVDAGRLPAVWGQAGKLGHVLTNLVGNAVKYVPATRGRISLSAESANGRVRLAVRDNGIGIPAAYHEGIFELFSRVPGKEQAVDGKVVAGTGMGLAIVKRIVEAHHGRVWVESAPGAGSTFWIELPTRPE
ncbi:MAG TPA: HAMP domain-containing sensor histidine kinase [Candidatus Binatia bacterium]|nr:HAMP domain-containing sensor histidine kinase [Candidatus Binatia bacterium]